MKLCDTCIYRNNVEQLKPCIIYRDDCEFYEKERGDMADDLISRSTIKHAIYDVCLRENNIDIFEKLLDRINDLPSVNPQEPKTGHWVMPVQDDGMSDPIYYQVRCSECGFDLDPQTWHQELHQYGADKFCPSCGCRMVEPQERSDKE